MCDLCILLADIAWTPTWGHASCLLLRHKDKRCGPQGAPGLEKVDTQKLSSYRGLLSCLEACTVFTAGVLSFPWGTQGASRRGTMGAESLGKGLAGAKGGSLGLWLVGNGGTFDGLDCRVRRTGRCGGLSSTSDEPTEGPAKPLVGSFFFFF